MLYSEWIRFLFKPFEWFLLFCRISSIDRPFIVAVLGAMATYTILLVQLAPVEDSHSVSSNGNHHYWTWHMGIEQKIISLCFSLWSNFIMTNCSWIFQNKQFSKNVRISSQWKPTENKTHHEIKIDLKAQLIMSCHRIYQPRSLFVFV